MLIDSSLMIPLLQVTNAVDHVNMGTDALRVAKSMQKKSRKCMMIAIILLLVIAIIVVLSILKPWKKWTKQVNLLLHNSLGFFSQIYLLSVFNCLRLNTNNARFHDCTTGSINCFSHHHNFIYETTICLIIDCRKNHCRR